MLRKINYALITLFILIITSFSASALNSKDMDYLRAVGVLEEKGFYFDDEKSFYDYVKENNKDIQKHLLKIDKDKFYYLASFDKSDTLVYNAKYKGDLRNAKTNYKELKEQMLEGNNIEDTFMFARDHNAFYEKYNDEYETLQTFAVKVEFESGGERFMVPELLINNNFYPDMLETYINFIRHGTLNQFTKTTLMGCDAYELYKDNPDEHNLYYNAYIDLSKALEKEVPQDFTTTFAIIEFTSSANSTEDKINRYNKLKEKVDKIRKGKIIVSEKELVSTYDYYNHGVNLATINESKSLFAKREKGMDEGVSIPSLLVVGTLGVAASLAGTTLASQKKKKDDDDEDDYTYRLYIDKDFGNRIKVGGKAKIVYAKVSKVLNSGKVIEEDSLLSHLKFSGGKYIKTGSIVSKPHFLGVEVFIEKDDLSELREDYIEVSFESEVGSFKEKLYFEVVGNAYIEYPNKPSYSEDLVVNMILGDNKTYKERLVFKDAIDLPSDLKFINDFNMNITYEKVDDYTYDFMIKNNSNLSDLKQYKIEERRTILVEAKVEDEVVKSSFMLSFYPLGLSLQANLNDDNNLVLYAKPSKDKGDLSYEIDPSLFKLILAIPEERDGFTKCHLVNLEKATLNEIKLKETDEISKNFLTNYEYEISDITLSEGKMSFVPLKQATAHYDKDDEFKKNPQDYQVLLNVNITYDNKIYNEDFSAVVVGERISSTAIRDIEYKRCIKYIKMFFEADEVETRLADFKKNSTNLGALELRAIEKSILVEVNRRYSAEYKEQMALSDTLDWCIWGASWVKWAGDIAFSVVIKYYVSASNAELVEAIVMPCKDMFTDYMGDLIGNVCFGYERSFGFDNIQTQALKGIENVVSNTVKLEYINKEQIGGLLVNISCLVFVYYSENVIEDYKTKNELNLIDNVYKTFGNLTNQFFKMIVGEAFGKIINSDAFKEFFEVFVSKQFAKKLLAFMDFNANITDKGFDKAVVSGNYLIDFISSGACQKIVEEIFGYGFGRLISDSPKYVIKPTDLNRSKDDIILTIPLFTADTNSGEDIKIEVNLTQVIMNTGSKLYDLIFEETIFKYIPCTKEILDLPNDVLIEDKKKN